MVEKCGAVSRQYSVCAREKGHDGCHEVYIDGDGRRWYGDMREYPIEEGDVILLGPECFVSKDGSVLNWKGVNYVPQREPGPFDRDVIEPYALAVNEAVGDLYDAVKKFMNIPDPIGPPGD